MYLPGRTTYRMEDAAAEFCALFPLVYVRFCRRDDDARSRLTPQMGAVLHHLSASGPLTVGEMATHFGRAQSVVSEIVDGMVRRGLLERMRDGRDRRRTLVWLSDEARELMARRAQVLDSARVESAMRVLAPRARERLVQAMRALVGAAAAAGPDERRGERKDRSNRRRR
ncbi:MAG TPA: MarR family winged helix-turn-helix transcriptional regulator [Polyangiaceae bacterium]|nr:MarR family winged helix-turn-helix transcriptional regulator [Polyangiaceae bacterium]